MSFTIKAIHSNLKAAHFAGKHEPGCDEIPENHRPKERIDDFQLKAGDLNDLLAKIISDGVKERGDNNPLTSSFGVTASAISFHTDSPKKFNILNVKSIRYLYRLFKNESFNKILYDNVRICDIYCGPSTKHIYTKYVTGLHLVHAQYNWCNDDKRTLYFRFPTIDNTQIKIYAHINDIDLYMTLSLLLKNHYRKPTLIFAVFDGADCNIESPTQVVPL